MMPHKCQTASYGGLTNREFQVIVEKIDPAPHIKNVMVHIGYKDSKYGPSLSTGKEIQDIVQRGKHAFPNATIFVGGVIPRKKNLNRTNIDDYNKAVENACLDVNAIFIPLVPCVTSAFGKKVIDRLYEDNLHLNTEGASALAKQLSQYLPVTRQMRDESTSGRQTDVDEDEDEDEEEVIPNDEDGSNPEMQDGPSIRTLPPFETGGNTFVTHVAKVSSRNDVRKVMTHVSTKYSDATTNSVAYRFIKESNGRRKPVQEVIDDGEEGAGAVMMDALNDYRVPGTIVIVSRYYGGKLGPRRFKVYYELTAMATGNDPRNNRPTPNKYPRSDKSPPLKSATGTGFPMYSQPQGYSASYQPSYQNWQSQPMYGQQRKWNNYGNQNGFSYRDMAANNVTQNSQFRGQRYTYFDGNRVNVQRY